MFRRLSQVRKLSIFGERGIPMKRRILLVDDDVAVLLTLKAVLEMHGFEVHTANSVADAVDKLKAGTYQMVITDMRMETENAGWQVVRAAKDQEYRPATAILTAYPPIEGDWRERGAQSLLVKPVGTNDLLRQIEALLVNHEDEKQRKQATPNGSLAAADISADRKGTRKAG
jgi:DNA-binding NtrC family response regulator